MVDQNKNNSLKRRTLHVPSPFALIVAARGALYNNANSPKHAFEFSSYVNTFVGSLLSFDTHTSAIPVSKI